jgi:Dopey, N-terminal
MALTALFSCGFRVLSHNDRVVIMKAATGTVLRKDMSLNRRLYAWILGPDELSRAQLNYMLTHAHQPFVQAINSLFRESISRKQDGEELALNDGQRPYRMLVSLMDKWEVGQPVLNTIFLDVIRCLKKESQLPEFNTEVLLLLHFTSPHLSRLFVWCSYVY